MSVNRPIDQTSESQQIILEGIQRRRCHTLIIKTVPQCQHSFRKEVAYSLKSNRQRFILSFKQLMNSYTTTSVKSK